MSELVGILEKTAVPQELQNAQKYLENAAQTNLPLFLKELSKGKSQRIHAIYEKQTNILNSSYFIPPILIEKY